MRPGIMCSQALALSIAWTDLWQRAIRTLWSLGGNR